MSDKSRAGKAAWAARAATYGEDLTHQISDRVVAGSAARMDAWIAHGRIPMRVRIMARVAGRPLPAPDAEAER